MTFIDDWKQMFPRLWSVRLALLAAILSAFEVGFNLFATGTAPVIAVIAMLVSLCAAFARVVAQPAVTGSKSSSLEEHFDDDPEQ